MTAISYHNTVNDLQGLPFSGSGPFARPEWFALLEQSGLKPCLPLARSDGEALALPLMENGNGLTGLSNWYAFSWQDLATPRAGDRMLEELARDLQRKTPRIVLDRVPDDHGTASRLERAFGKAGWVVDRRVCDANHVLDVAGRSFTEYLASRPGRLRTTLKRKARKVSIEILAAFDEDAWASYEHVYTQSWKPEESDPAMLKQFAQAEGAAGRIRLGLARYEGKVIAAQFWTVEDGIAYIHKLAHLESAKPLSAGTTLTAALFEHAIDRDRVGMVDFGTGNDPYKQDWMEQIRHRYRLTFWKPGEPANWPDMGKSLLRKLVPRRHAD